MSYSEKTYDTSIFTKQKEKKNQEKNKIRVRKDFNTSLIPVADNQ
jgi:hypothetical protein